MDPFNEPARPLRSILMIGLEWFSDNPGGGGRYLTDVARGLAARGHRLTVLVPRLDDAHPATEVIDDVRIVRFPLAGPLARLRAPYAAVPDLVAAYGPFDVVHSHFAQHGLGPLWHPALSGALKVCQFQGPWAEESRVEGQGGLAVAAKWAIEKAAYARCDRFIVLSEGFGRLLAQDYGVDPGRIRVIPAAVDTDRFALSPDREGLRRALGWGSGPVVFVMRRLVKRMGLEVLLAAFARVQAALPEARLVVGGTGPLREALEAQAASLGVAEAVHFTGRLSDADLVRHYQAADLTVVPTVALEGFGLVTVESLACGTPVLGTAEGGTAEILAPFAPGLLVPPDRADLLAERLTALLSGQAPLPDAHACRAYAMSRYHWPLVLDQVEEVLSGEAH